MVEARTPHCLRRSLRRTCRAPERDTGHFGSTAREVSATERLGDRSLVASDRYENLLLGPSTRRNAVQGIEPRSTTHLVG